jgi:hypothetical protein
MCRGVGAGMSHAETVSQQVRVKSRGREIQSMSDLTFLTSLFTERREPDVLKRETNEDMASYE